MRIKRLWVFVVLGALCAVAACSNSNPSVVPAGSNAPLTSPNILASADASASANGVAAAASPLKLEPSMLSFGVGSTQSKHFLALETGYKGMFRIENGCGKHVTFTPKDAKGPRVRFDVTPVSPTSCSLTVVDTKKHQGLLLISVAGAPTPSPTPGTTPTPSATPSTSPSPHPSATPTTAPTATPTSIPTTTPMPVIKNGNFASGLVNWTPCSFTYTWTGPVNANPAPMGTPAATPTPEPFSSPIAASTLSPLAAATSPPANLNPNYAGVAPAVLGSNVALLGDPGSENKGSAGICQTFTVDATYKYLSFWAWEGGSEYNIGNATQEADILDSTATTVLAPLFVEQNCFWDPGVVGQTGYLNNGCIPAADGGTSSYTDWQGGYWVQRGPYDFSAYVGQTVTLFLGVWDKNNHGSHAAPTTYGNEMFVGNVQFSNTNSFPTSFPYARHHAVKKPSRGGRG